jgi:hypothetical protein
MKKRGQLTVFISVAIVIVFLIITSFVFVDVNKNSIVNPEVRVIYDSISSCVDEITEDSLEDIGISGGYFDLPSQTSNLSIPYFYISNENVMPSIEVIASEIEKYNEVLLYFCFQKAYADLPDYDVSSGEIGATVNVREEDTVLISIDYPFTVVKNNKSYYFNDGFERKYDVRLYSIHRLISQIIAKHTLEPRALCVNCFSDLALEYKLYVDLWDSGDDVLFFITDPEHFINDGPYEFYFVIKPEKPEYYDPFEAI